MFHANGTVNTLDVPPAATSCVVLALPMYHTALWVNVLDAGVMVRVMVLTPSSGTVVLFRLPVEAGYCTVRAAPLLRPLL